MTNKILIISMMSLVFFFGCVTAEQKLKEQNIMPLSQSQLKELYEGGCTVDFTSPRTTGTVTYKADGTTDLQHEHGSDTGTYTIENDSKLCTQWSSLRDGKKGCFTIYKLGENKYRALNSDGSLNSDFSFK